VFTQKQEGLGVTDLSTHNEVVLLKYLHKFFSKADIPWVKLVWENYYSNGKLPDQHKKGSFWWRDIVSISKKYKGISLVMLENSSTVLFWKDKWGNIIPAQAYPELYSFATKPYVTFLGATSLTDFAANFNLPLSIQAHE
jgi:hypothetical protein